MSQKVDTSALRRLAEEIASSPHLYNQRGYVTIDPATKNVMHDMAGRIAMMHGCRYELTARYVSRWYDSAGERISPIDVLHKQTGLPYEVCWDISYSYFAPFGLEPTGETTAQYLVAYADIWESEGVPIEADDHRLAEKISGEPAEATCWMGELPDDVKFSPSRFVEEMLKHFAFEFKLPASAINNS